LLRGFVHRVLPLRWRFRLFLVAQVVRHPVRYWRRWRLMSVRRPWVSVAMVFAARRLRAQRTAVVGMDRLPAVVVINLRSRADRLASFTAEIERLGIDRVSRFDAIRDPVGILGCSRSHAECARVMIERGWEFMMVCEDDARFRVDRAQLDLLVEAFLNDPSAEVACLGYAHRVVEPHNWLFVRALETHTAPCYVIKATIVKDLFELWQEGIEQLERGGDRHLYGNDQIWKRLQRDRVFLIPIKRAVYQEEGYSDIEQRVMSWLT